MMRMNEEEINFLKPPANSGRMPKPEPQVYLDNDAREKCAQMLRLFAMYKEKNGDMRLRQHTCWLIYSPYQSLIGDPADEN